MVEIPIRDENLEGTGGDGSANSDEHKPKRSSKDKLRSEDSGLNPDVEPRDSKEDQESADWNKTSKLAEEISQSFEETDLIDSEMNKPLEIGDEPPDSWRPTMKKAWPPMNIVDPFAGAAAVHSNPVDEEEDDERVPYDKSTEVGVMHGEPIESTDYDQIHQECARLNAEVNAMKNQVKENFELAQRKQAEFSNYKRRSKQEIEDYKKRAIENLVVDLIPVLDSLEKAVWSVPKGEENTPLADGIRRTLALFLNTLTRYKVTLVNDINVPFDPGVHACLYFEDTDDYDDNTVLEIYQNGYVLADRLIRPAMVKLSRKPDSERVNQTNDFAECAAESDSEPTTDVSAESVNETDS